MLLDARELTDTNLTADVCIVGSGPAGLVLAGALQHPTRRILLLESGGLTADSSIQELNEGVVTGPPYAGLRQTRIRQVGGAANIWNTPIGGDAGAKYTPLETRDFGASSSTPWSGWPFGSEVLEPYYRLAQQVSGLGPFRYDAESWCSGERPCLDPGPTPLVSAIYQFGPANRFTHAAVSELAMRDDALLYHGATVVDLEQDHAGGRVRSVVALARDGTRLTVHARWFVLATGAVENARLLLTAGSLRLRDPGNWLGRCFMEHPRDFTLSLRMPSPDLHRQLRFYDLHRANDGTMISGRLGVHTEELRQAGLPSASVTVLPQVAMKRPFWSRWLNRVQGGRIQPGGGYGWSEIEAAQCNRCRLVVNVEQRPARENRILLDQGRDRYGMPRAHLQWRWTPDEQAGLDRLRRSLAQWCERAGLGRLSYQPGLPPDLNAHHHAGTTRMHEDPRGGMVDPDLRVHGMENLYVAGSSVFPSAGWANPMLTIVALSLRLGDHLRSML